MRLRLSLTASSRFCRPRSPLSFVPFRTARIMATKQPPWEQPLLRDGTQLPQLKIYNSLTRTKTPFIPIDSEGKKVTWYSCGPTVYDDAHIGHARNYVSIDVIRRIMKDYFKFDLRFVQNVTDVDDKIILRARQQHLLEVFRKEHPQIDQTVIETARAAFNAYIKKNLPLLPADLQPSQYDTEAKKTYGHVTEGKALSGDGPPGDKEAKIKMHLRTASAAATVLSAVEKNADTIKLEDFYAGTGDALLPYLDSLHGSSIDAKDHSIFTKLTKKFEQHFMDDMRQLNVQDPDVITRVTEFGPQIADFVDKIVQNKYGYTTSDGSVYFDINSFEKAGNSYARLAPWSKNNQELQADGEGALTKETTEKRSPGDFALWKSSKPGEPSWPSVWGEGRPGWHIECSAMASSILGKQIDIHSGGIDLAFPHHDNELAQSEAYWLDSTKAPEDHHSHQWINYFLHMGHLSIQGSKMSKSLKNFITIKEALRGDEYNPRNLRIIFLLGGWKEPIEITESMRKSSKTWEDKVNNFFLKAIDLEKHSSNNSASATEDATLLDALKNTQSELDAALCDSFDTPTAMRAISTLITTYNSIEPTLISDESVLSVARWITQIVTIFGLDASGDLTNSQRIGWPGATIPKSAEPFVYPASRLRDEVRRRAIAGTFSSEEIAALASQDTVTGGQESDGPNYAEALSQFQNDVKSLAEKNAPAKDYLALCDQLRDVRLWDLGIYLEDREGKHALVRPIDKELLADRAKKEAQAEQKRIAKEKREKEEAEKARLRREQAKVRPGDMFKTDEFGEWDADGVPTKDAKGEELAKSRFKKLRKEWEKQKKLHEEFLTEA